MDFQTTCSRVPLITARVRAHERFLTGVRQFMRLKMTLGYELLSTLLTDKRSLTGMRSHMCFQIASF